MEKGVVIIAHNNPEIDYGQMALINALMVKTNMKVPVCMITDEGTIGWLKQNYSEPLINYAFDMIKFIDIPGNNQNYRIYRDSIHMSKKLAYNNQTRIDVYDLTPFEETLLLDTDFLIQNDSLNAVWGSTRDVMMNKKIDSLSPTEYFYESSQLNGIGIPQYWATAMYFRKSETAEILFNLANHIRENYDFYKYMFGFSGSCFRNDFVYSIALHMMAGFVEDDYFSLPVESLFFTSDLDVLIDVKDKNELVFLIEKHAEKGNYYAAKIDNMNVHVMNKYSINRFAKEFINLYTPKELLDETK